VHIFSIGLSHTSAPVDVRERLTFSEEQIRASLARLSCGHITSSLAEAIIISTCNRTEIYAVSNKLPFAELEAFLSDVRSVPVDKLHPYVYRFCDMDVAHHLFNVAAGLNSVVIGEPQILGQVTRSLELARGQNAVGPILNRLFQAAIHAGKRSRTETAISRNPASVSSLAASMAERAVGHIKTANVVVLGAGEMAELTVEALRKRGVEKILVINRTLTRAQGLAQRWGSKSATFEFLLEALVEADILISSTGAPHTLISYEMVDKAMRERPERPLALIDIAVPRDIDSDAASLPGVQLYDIDRLNTQLDHSIAERTSEVPQVKIILEEELSQFEEYMKSLEMLPIIADMHQQAEDIRQRVLDKALRRMPDLTEAERDRIEAMTQALVRKLLDAPTQRLRAEASCPHAPEYAAVARTLFGLHNGRGPCGFSGSECPISSVSD
jgi:glutamyl-tRNA reductase